MIKKFEILLVFLFIDIIYISESVSLKQKHKMENNSLEEYEIQDMIKIKQTGAECKQNSSEELKILLEKAYKHSMDKMLDGIDSYPPVQEKFAKNIINSTDLDPKQNYLIHGNTNCSINKQTPWRENEISICPHHFVEVKRHDRFPFSIKQAICNCKSCLDVKSDFLRCVPTFIVKPVLIRHGCLANGFYNWKRAFEYVPVSCSCKQLLTID